MSTMGAAGAAQAERFGQFQSELIAKIQEVNRHWLERSQAEAALATEFAAKMSSARSFPEAASICQEWAGRRLKLASEDANYALSAGRSLMEVGARLMPGDGKGPTGST
jgi:hypothetical protein